MKTIVAFLLLAFFVHQSFGQGAQGAAITQRARDMRDQNNAAQGAAAKNPSVPAQPGPSAQPQPPKPLSPAQIQQQNLNKLKSDIASFLTDTAVSQEKIGRFATNLTAVARGPKKPAAAAINKLATGIGTQLTGRTLTPADQTRLAENLEAVVNGSKLSRLQTEAYIADIQKILQQSGAKTEDAAAVAADVKATLAEIKL
ncbi:MAG TPA: hypothetical protein PKA41_06905 [Verrucomicrobiota bacterium]|nr:hypothetical protein [Verrucomicrobiota bacterium]